jgi:hypothetical protein
MKLTHGWVIQDQNGHYCSTKTSLYTNNLDEAKIFATRREARAEKALSSHPESEKVVRVQQYLRLSA